MAPGNIWRTHLELVALEIWEWGKYRLFILNLSVLAPEEGRSYLSSGLEEVVSIIYEMHFIAINPPDSGNLGVPLYQRVSKYLSHQLLVLNDEEKSTDGKLYHSVLDGRLTRR